MAEIVSIIGITHNPFMPRLFQQPQQPPGAAKVKERIAMMRQKLADANPDVLVCIGNDHLHQFFMDNMPAFMIGKMEQYNGTFYDEEREFGLPRCKLPGDLDAADAIMEGAFDRGVDFSYSNELTIDHSIIVPMMFVRPAMDIPIVPILTNCIAPPMPRARRYFEVGKALRGAIDNLPANKRIGVLVSGHLSLEIGGPKQFERHLTDPSFRRRCGGLDRQRRYRWRGRGLHGRKNDRCGQYDQRLSKFFDDDGRGQRHQAVLRRRPGRGLPSDSIL